MVGIVGFLDGIFDSVGSGQYYAHATMSDNFRFPKNANLYAGFGKHFSKLSKTTLSVSPSTTIAREAEGP